MVVKVLASRSPCSICIVRILNVYDPLFFVIVWIKAQQVVDV
jgi:hypothetical protein